MMIDFDFKFNDSESEVYWNSIPKGKWEPETFKILDQYKNPNLVYIDIGSWIGPTVLYASQKYKKVISLEVDPEPVKKLKNNILINNISNVNFVEKALYDKTGEVNFFSRSSSMSTFSKKNPKGQKETVIDVKTITFEDLLVECKTQAKDIALIKMDIEGGEIKTIPSMKDFLTKFPIPLYISLHPMFLDNEEIDYLQNTLRSIYKNVKDLGGKHPEFICRN